MRHVRWYGVTAASPQSIFTTYMNVLFTVRGVPCVRFLSSLSAICVVNRNFISIGAGTIAFAIRSGVNLVLLLARIKNLSKCVCIPYSNTSQHAQN